MHRCIPLCILSSGGWLVPIGAVFGLEEDYDSLIMLHEAIAQHCKSHDVVCPAFDLHAQFRSQPVQADSDHHAWAVIHLKDHLFPPEFESFIVSVMRGDCADDAALQFIPVVNPPPTLHSDGAPAFAKLCRTFSWVRTSCGKHLEANVASCDPELKRDVCKLLYERHLSPGYAEEHRVATVEKAGLKPISSKTRDRVLRMFATDCMRESIQALRNHIYSAGYVADTLLETMFRHIKQEQR
jgi:hypothetical protein